MIPLIFRGIYIIISLCLMLKQYHMISPIVVIAFLSAVILTCVASMLPKHPITPVLCLIYALLSFFFPPFVMFFPVVVFEFSNLRSQKMHISSGAPKSILGFIYVISIIAVFLSYIFFYMQNDTFMNITLLVISVLAFLTHLISDRNDELKSTLHYVKDLSGEHELMLKRKNHELMEKQDYEIYLATLQERNRIAREIHDNVGHLLTRSILQTGALKAMTSDPTEKENLEEIRKTLDDAMTCIRDSVHDLHDDSIDLQAALTNMAGSFTAFKVTLDYDSDLIIERQVKYSVLSIVREALNNVSKHSDATAVSIVFRKHPAFYQLLIEDNGTAKNPSINEGIGLITLRERIDQLHGTVQISTEHGFRIFICIPIN